MVSIVFRVLAIMCWVNEGIIWAMNWLDLFWIPCDKSGTRFRYDFLPGGKIFFIRYRYSLYI